MSCGLKEAIVFGVALVAGTGTTLTGKVLYGVTSTGLDGTPKKFEKPIFQTWLMFLAMCGALPMHWLYHWYLDYRWRRSGHRRGHKRAPRVPRKVYFVLAIPAIFDLIATFLANIGLLYVTVSVFQLVKSTIIVFVALLKVTVIHDRLRGYMWIGIVLNTIAVLMASATSFGDAGLQINNSEDSHPAFGIFMIVISCAVQASQYVFEERLMDEGTANAPPMIVVGMEGVWGLIFTTFVVYPIAYLLPGPDLGSHERFDDAYVMMANSSLARVVVLIYLLAILGYNIFGVSVTYLLSSIWHAILDNFRPMTVWGADLALFYIFTHRMFGEAWTPWSWLQLGGMIMLLLGTAVYNGTLKLPGHVYLEPIEKALTPIRTAAELASTSLSHSPLITRNAMKAADIARRTPIPGEGERVRRAYMTEYQPLVDVEARGRDNNTGIAYGSLDN